MVETHQYAKVMLFVSAQPWGVSACCWRSSFLLMPAFLCPQYLHCALRVLSSIHLEDRASARDSQSGLLFAGCLGLAAMRHPRHDACLSAHYALEGAAACGLTRICSLSTFAAQVCF